MTQASIAELVESWRPRYLKASRKEKTLILNEFVALTGYHRKSAIRLLRHGRKPKHLDRRGRPRIYTPDAKAALGGICSKRLAPFLPEIVAVLKQKGVLQDPAGNGKTPSRNERGHHRPPPSYPPHPTEEEPEPPKPGTFLRKKIPVGTFADWDEGRPGFLEVDLVANFGESAKGEYLHTLCAPWIWPQGGVPLRYFPTAVSKVKEAVDRIRRGLPFPLLGIDSDNDSAFINANLFRYCQKEGITFTRCRPGKNDQTYVEKCWTAVRKLVGYERYTFPEDQELLEKIYRDGCLFVNFFQPVQKLLAKERKGGKTRKVYDVAKTPFQQVLASPYVDKKEKGRLRKIDHTLNHVALRRRVEEHLGKLRRHHG